MPELSEGKPFVSVIIPTYNRAGRLAATPDNASAPDSQYNAAKVRFTAT